MQQLNVINHVINYSFKPSNGKKEFFVGRGR